MQGRRLPWSCRLAGTDQGVQGDGRTGSVRPRDTRSDHIQYSGRHCFWQWRCLAERYQSFVCYHARSENSPDASEAHHVQTILSRPHHNLGHSHFGAVRMGDDAIRTLPRFAEQLSVVRETVPIPPLKDGIVAIYHFSQRRRQQGAPGQGSNHLLYRRRSYRKVSHIYTRIRSERSSRRPWGVI